ncbi:hypothetical protein UFOVP225_60 [uncultured Caudovirales phage]|uniref:Uncharacterized protein n=1 Tax=uncultured Caudovirales phage TaxID=2100421 RepID=A0A6J7WNK3_9CAUD|nr:hypothetical protein UFOVP113_73 [uncultured Caudovirales phage]CAB5219360.1 hypothetical protein UFOVP225_60 [uncultured Caudovirales phage]
MAISLQVWLYNETNARITASADSDGDISIRLTAENRQGVSVMLSPAQAKQLKKLLSASLAESKATRKANAEKAEAEADFTETAEPA